MATHFICQATEPLPHGFPTSRAPEKGHGAVSQYELLNLSDKAHCQFPPTGWNTSESSEDSLPLFQAPAPSWKSATNIIGPDPSLCITPEKSLAGKALSLQNRNNNAPVPEQQLPDQRVDPDLDLTLTPSKGANINCTKEQKSNLRQGCNEDGKFKGQHRVRFELDTSKGSSDGGDESFLFSKSRSMKPYKPSSYCDKDENVMETEMERDVQPSIKPKQYTVNSINSRTVYVPVSNNEKGKGCNLANHFEKGFDQDDMTKDGVEYSSVLPEVVNSEQSVSKPLCHVQNHKTQGNLKDSKKINKKEKTSSNKDSKNYIKGDSQPKRKVKVKRETSEHPELIDYNFPFSDGIPDASEYEHVFNRPEYNSTLRMRTELQQIKDSQVDVCKALEKKLQLSESKRIEITEKATSKVNTKDSMFNGLVSLETPVEDLCNKVEQNKSSKVPSKITRPKSQTAKHSNEPDLMEFFTPELQKEMPELSLPGFAAPSESLSTANHIRAFDLYRHNRVWENTSYFSAMKKK